jgi:hypothetical protein
LVEKTEPFVRTKCKWESNVNFDLKEIDVRVWTEFILLRIGTFRLQKNQGISLLAEELLASRDRFGDMEFFC